MDILKCQTLVGFEHCSGLLDGFTLLRVHTLFLLIRNSEAVYGNAGFGPPCKGLPVMTKQLGVVCSSFHHFLYCF